MKFTRLEWLLLFGTIGFYILFFTFNVPVDFKTCKLCDGKQYLKLYWFFESGTTSQITYPFYTRPLIPLLASLVPGKNPFFAFHFINALFILFGVISIHRLWKYLKIPDHLQWVGFVWLLLHWTGIIRYNLFDFITTDVPVYFIQALALTLFFRKKFGWFYLITPLAILQKESFIGVMVMLIIIHFWEHKALWFRNGQHLVYALFIGLSLQYLIVHVILPSQNHQWHPVLTLTLTTKMTLEDPTRVIRWFAAFGGAYGVIPFIIFFRFKKTKMSIEYKALLLLSLMYCGFGILAGEDMTRILFLGFPFIFTLSLFLFQEHKKWLLLTAILLSLVSLRINELVIKPGWAVDYRELNYVYFWAIYYASAVALFFLAFKFETVWLKTLQKKM